MCLLDGGREMSDLANPSDFNIVPFGCEREALCPAAPLFNCSFGFNSSHELQHSSGKHLPPGDCNSHQCPPEW